MAKHESNVPDERDLKKEVELSDREIDLRQMLNLESTPEEEQKVLRKLDLM